MRVCHVESAVFDDPNLVSCGGLGPVVALAQRCDLAALVGTHLSLPSKGGANAPAKVSALVAGMVAVAGGVGELLRVGRRRPCGRRRPRGLHRPWP